MNILTKTLLAASLVALSASAASACNVNYRQHFQTYRIFVGAGGGSLTFGEFVRLAGGHARVRQMERLARLDGHIDPWECMWINRALNKQSRRIYRLKHN